VAPIVDELGLGLKKYQDDKRVQMLNDPLQYLKARNAAYKAVAASADAVYCGALYQIAQSVTVGVPANDGEITARADELAANTDDEPPVGPWAPAIINATRLLWVKRLAAETAMKFPLEGEAKKSQRKINDKAREAAKDKISQSIKG